MVLPAPHRGFRGPSIERTEARFSTCPGPADSGWGRRRMSPCTSGRTTNAKRKTPAREGCCIAHVEKRGRDPPRRFRIGLVSRCPAAPGDPTTVIAECAECLRHREVHVTCRNPGRHRGARGRTRVTRSRARRPGRGDLHRCGRAPGRLSRRYPVTAREPISRAKACPVGTRSSRLRKQRSCVKELGHGRRTTDDSADREQVDVHTWPEASRPTTSEAIATVGPFGWTSAAASHRRGARRRTAGGFFER